MSPKFSIQDPYVLASLPRPIDRSSGRYVVGEVFGGAHCSKKRKRSELVVGVDGEGVNLYDISASRLITSYALPPQTSFTCPPTSLRIKVSKTNIERRTYVSTAGLETPQITLFLETGKSLSNKASILSHKLENSKAKVVFLGTLAGVSDATAKASDLLLVKEDGEIQCLDGSNLKERWTSPATALQKSPTPTGVAVVEFAHLTNAHSASQGILKGRQDIFALFPQEISEDGFNPDMLFIITRTSNSRTVHLVTLPRRSASWSGGFRHSVESLLTMELPSLKQFSPEATFNLQVSSGHLLQLSKTRLAIFDLSETLPKVISRIRTLGAYSFLPLSSTSVVVSSGTSLNVYNTKFLSLLGSTQIDRKSSSDISKRKRVDPEHTNGELPYGFSLVSYFPKLRTAVGILEHDLVGIQIDSRGKGRAAGLLIDSIGCAIPGQSRANLPGKNPGIGLSTIKSYMPSSITVGNEIWDELKEPLEQAFKDEDTAKFDSLMASQIVRSSEAATLGKPLVNGSVSKDTKLPQSTADVDRRWIIYALSKIFAWSREDEVNEYRLSISFYPRDTFSWLLRTGNMTISNIESALRYQNRVRGRQSFFDSLPSGKLVDTLVEMDQDMELLHILVAETSLGAVELLTAIRHLMNSLGLLGDNSQAMQKLLTNGEDSEWANGDVDEQVKRLEAEVEADLELAEYQLGPGSGVRGEALSLALSKLYTCPSNDIVCALQTMFSIQDVVALIYLLRFELARGAWTTRYLDVDQLEITDEEAAVPDNAIIPISSLLNNCIDAIGAGGWLSGNARLVSGDPFEAEELISSLKLEVSAALEGIEEAVYLRGLTSEMIRYGGAVQAGISGPAHNTPAGKNWRIKPVMLPSSEQEMKILPLGLKADRQISLLKVGFGGEVHERTRRDIGHLKSQRVAKYTLERIII